MAVTLLPSAYQSNVLIQSFRVYVMSLVQKYDTTRIETLSDMQLILLDIIAQLRDSTVYEWSVQTDNVPLNDFVDDFDGECAGYWFTLNLKIPNALSQCAAPFNPVVIKEPIDDELSDSTSFIITIDTTNAGSGSDTFVLPCGDTGTYNAVIDWGDSSTSNITTYNDANLSHTYALGGIYTVQVSGVLPWVKFANGGDKLKITDITQWGTVEIESLDQSYWGCTNLSGTYTDTPTFSSGDKVADFAFRSSGFNGLVSTWDMSTFTSVRNIFQANTAFNQPMFIMTSNTANMASMFSGATLFNQDLSGSDYSGATTMAGFIENTSFSTDNYDLLLIELSSQTLISNGSLGVMTVSYTIATSGAAHDDLVDNDLWTIIDGGGI